MTEVVGALIFDSWIDSTPKLRGGGAGDRHLIYEGDGVLLDLLIRREQDGIAIQISGQILPGDTELDKVSDVAVFLESGEYRAHTHTNALGEFSFRTIPNGALDLSVALEKRRFLVRGLQSNDPGVWQVLSTLGKGNSR